MGVLKFTCNTVRTLWITIPEPKGFQVPYLAGDEAIHEYQETLVCHLNVSNISYHTFSRSVVENRHTGHLAHLSLGRTYDCILASHLLENWFCTNAQIDPPFGTANVVMARDIGVPQSSI